MFVIDFPMDFVFGFQKEGRNKVLQLNLKPVAIPKSKTKQPHTDSGEMVYNPNLPFFKF